MKLFSAFTTMVAANNMLPMMMLMDDDANSEDMMLLMMMNSMGVSQTDPMANLLPMMLLMDDDDSTTTTTTTDNDNSDALMMMMMLNPDALNDPNMMMPMLLLGDGSLDMKSMFLMTSMMQKDCAHDTNSQMNAMLPLLIDDADGDSSKMLKSILMLQMMSDPTGAPLDMNSILPMLMLSDDDSSETMMLVLLSSMSGAASYESNFNLLLPLALKDCPANDDACEQDKTDMMIMMMMMSSQSPSSGTTVDSMLPMLLMSDDSNNENLLFFMMMQNGQQCLPSLPAQDYVAPVENEVIDDTVIYRTWRLNDDGTRTLISEGETD